MRVDELSRIVINGVDEFGRIVVDGISGFGRIVFPLAPPPTALVTISGIAVTLKKHSLMVDTRIEERSIAHFTVEDSASVLSFQRGEYVMIYDTAGQSIFGGFISNPEQERMSPDGGLWHPIRCMDNHYLADKRRMAESYTGQTCGFIVNDIYNNYLAEEGVAIGSIEAGPILIEAIFNYVSVSEALDALAEKAGKIWYIDEIRNLYFVDRDTIPAPWDADGDDMLKGSAMVSGENPLYRNRQYVRGGRDITGPQVETFAGDGSNVAFAVGYPINSVPTVTLVGVPQTIGIKGIDTTSQCYWSKGDPIVVFAAAPALAAAVVISYVGQYDVLVLVTDENEITAQKTIEGAFTTGYVDDVTDETKLDDKDAMFDSGKAKLAKYSVSGKRLHYKTLRLGLRPGQIQSITYPAFGLAAEEMLIESVSFGALLTETVHEITAIQGPEMGSWAQYFKRLASQKDEIMEKLNVGSQQILIILVSKAETWEWTESITTTVYACPVVALTLHPGLTLYPC